MADAQLSRPQFDVLYVVHKDGPALTREQLLTATGATPEVLDALLGELTEQGLLAEGRLTAAGWAALEPYRVENAVIMAAGLSARFAPVSYEHPKGMLRVRGEILVERQIRQLHEAGVTDVTIVVGYKKEAYLELAERLGARIVVNEDYMTRNNNGSLWLVREQLGNTYICSCDDYFTVNPFESHVHRAYYAAQYVEGPTDEWCLETDPDGRITGARIGGRDAWVMLGHAYFDRPFSEAFRRVLDQTRPLPETAPKLWESLYLEHIDELDMDVRRYPPGVIHEFDSLAEATAFDPQFVENVGSQVLENIASTLGCATAQIGDFYPLTQGITNLSCHFAVDGREYVYRHPGLGTDKIVDRRAEAEALRLAARLGLDRTFLACDPEQGWKISSFVPDARNLDVGDDEELARAMTMIRRLHESGQELARSFDYIREGLRYEELLRQHGPVEDPGYEELRARVLRLKACADADGFGLVPSHNDFFQLNFLVDPDGHLDLIDWEYAGMSDPANDFGTMVVCAELGKDRAEEALSSYFGRAPSRVERRHFWAYVVLAGWCWYVWALLKTAEGDDVGPWTDIYHRYAVEYVDAVLALYGLGDEPLAAGGDSSPDACAPDTAPPQAS